MGCESISVVVDASDPVEAVVSVAADVVASAEEAGAPGASAYDVWLAQPGNEGGSVDDFLAYMATLGTPQISSDADNRLTTGSDGGLYVPEMVSDPLAYYILAKA